MTQIKDKQQVQPKLFKTNFYNPYDTKKRTRTTKEQLEALEAVFQCSPKPTISVRRDLSAKLDMPIRNVQVWFQNRRAKAKNTNSYPGEDQPPAEAERIVRNIKSLTVKIIPDTQITSGGQKAISSSSPNHHLQGDAQPSSSSQAIPLLKQQQQEVVSPYGLVLDPINSSYSDWAQAPASHPFVLTQTTSPISEFTQHMHHYSPIYSSYPAPFYPPNLQSPYQNMDSFSFDSDSPLYMLPSSYS